MRRRHKLKRLLYAIFGCGIILTTTTACFGASQAKTNASQCAFIIQNGYFDSHHIKDILLPGQKASKNGASAHYVYCNARNYLVATGSTPDEPNAISVRTASTGSDAGTQIEVKLAVYWQLNQSKAALTEFLPFCQKYNCYSAAGDTSSAHSSSTGWNTMLAENFSPTLQRATVEAAGSLDSNLPNEQSKWPALGDAIAKNFMTDVQITDGQAKSGGGSGTDFFCASGSSEKNCAPVSVQVQSIEYANQAAQDLATQSANLAQQQALAQQKLTQQDQLAQAQGRLNADNLAAAKQKYGDAASSILGELDTIAACKDAGAQCVITLGGGPTPVVTVPTK